MRWRTDSNSQWTSSSFLADMRTEEGTAVRWQAEKLAMETAVQLARRLSALPQYQTLIGVLPMERVDLYFEKRINAEIYPAIRALCVMEWCIRNGRPPTSREVVWHHHQNLGPALREVWPSSEVPLVLGAPRTLYAAARTWGKEMRAGLYRLVEGRKWGSAVSRVRGSDGPTIAIHYAEGTDLSRRSDLFWYDQSQVDPSRILVYFEGVSSLWMIMERVDPREVVRDLERLGMRRVSLGHQSVGLGDTPLWHPGGEHRVLLKQWRRSIGGVKPATPTERWVSEAARRLLGEVGRWRSFYDSFNIKVHMEIDEGGYGGVAQCIAQDMTGGVHVGRQRSDSWVWDWGYLGHHPDHVYFAWNHRAVAHAVANRNRIGSAIVSGFHHDGAWRSGAAPKELRAKVSTKGARFVVALFDNVFVWYGSFSKSMMQAFYTAFLEWVLEDPHVGVITKSKKPKVFQELPEIRGLMERAVATGRWINLSNVYGRLPSDASRAADISVGIGISSAVIEAVAAGGKGVHCDLTATWSHPFYQWGYDKVVFDDLNRMMAALKHYSSEPALEPGLGDFSQRMDQVDPFHDGRSGERVGAYLRWLLEAFDEGKDRGTAIRRANERYARMWGEDNVICTEFMGQSTKGEETLSR